MALILYFLCAFIILLQLFIIFKKTKTSSLGFNIEDYDERYSSFRDSFLSLTNNKVLKKSLKLKKKNKDSLKDQLIVIKFDGDIKATAASDLDEVITSLIPVLQSNDIVVCQINSGGGSVPHYGFVSSALSRLRPHCHLVASIDIVAASGGYMMASVAHEIIAAPFSIVGSIGVVAQVPNFNKFLKQRDVEFEEHTAGDCKRSLTMFGENTDQKREKFSQKLDVTHKLFKEHIKSYRPTIDIDKVADGDYFYTKESVELLNNNLIDKIQTLEEFLHEKQDTHRIWRITQEEKKSFLKKCLSVLGMLYSKVRSI